MAVERKVKLAPWGQMLFQPSRYKAMHGGRAVGKSQNIATALVLKLRERPLRWLCCREVQISLAESSKKTIENKIVECGLSGFYTLGERDIKGANGAMFLFAGLTDADKIKSMEGLGGAWVAEAQTVSRRSLELLDPTVREPGSELWFDWNPEKETDPVDEMFRGEGGPPPDSIVIEVTQEMNPWFPEVLRAKMEWDRVRDPDLYQHVWLGGYRRISGASVFKHWTVREFETPEDARLHLGADWGFSVDPTVLTRSFVGILDPEGRAVADPQGNCLFVDYEAYKVGCSIDDHPALFDRVPGSRKWPIVADSARPEMIDHMQKNGFPIRAAKKGPGSVETGISYLQQFNIVVHPRCPHTADELALCSWRVDRHTGDVLPKLRPGNDHCIDSLRYGHEGMRPPTGKLTSVVVPRRPLSGPGAMMSEHLDFYRRLGGGGMPSMWTRR